MLSDQDSVDIEVEFKPGLTFWLGVSGLVLALGTSVLLFMSANFAGNGPLYCGGDDGGRGNHAHTTHRV